MTEERSRIGRMSRRKGASYERELVHRFREIFGEDVKRGLQSRGTEEVPDVDGTPFYVEAKRGKKPNVRGALKQATDACSDHRIPLAVIRDDRSDAFVALDLEDFLEIIKEWWELKNG